MRPIDDPKYQALALCPVCGNKDYLHFICDDGTDTNVMCANCGLQSAWADDCNTATEQWNKFAAPPLREGWVSVPREPTKQMLDAGFNDQGKFSSVYGIYKAMIAAASEE